ncbi:MAG TPA: hypothetical protein VFP66_05330, partial [Candidatus Limnocylindrales bacterium]|nr:hypothetical protein [Candidatus Limnocylindrales bacterium]
MGAPVAGPAATGHDPVARDATRRGLTVPAPVARGATVLVRSGRVEVHRGKVAGRPPVRAARGSRVLPAT